MAEMFRVFRAFPAKSNAYFLTLREGPCETSYSEGHFIPIVDPESLKAMSIVSPPSENPDVRNARLIPWV